MQSKRLQYFSNTMFKGFSYLIPNGSIITDYPRLGVIIILKNSLNFFDGENMSEICRTENQINVITLRDKLLCVGQKLFKGQLTTTTLIDLESKQVKKYRYQKTIMQSLTISKNCDYLCSIGSSDLGRQQFHIINLTQELEMGFKSVAEEKYQEKDKNKVVMVLFSGKQNNLLAILFSNRLVLATIQGDKLTQKPAKANKVREFSMVIFDPFDISCFVCSKNGDISEIYIKQVKQARIGPRKRVIIAGIKHIRFVHPDRLIITGVKGFMALIELKEMKILKEVTINEEIVSLTEFMGDLGYVSTKMGNIFIVDAETLNITQFYTCHHSKINSIVFSECFDEVFGSCAGDQIIMWKTATLSPLIKIKLPQKTCLCLYLPKDGKSIISGWNDDCIRVFNPISGKETNKITKANNSQVTALTGTQNLEQIFSGGKNGSIRMWDISNERFGIIHQLFTGHRGAIHNMYVQGDLMYSCSQDGSFAIWNFKKEQKQTMVQVGNFVKQIYPVNDFEVMTLGSGSKMSIIRKNDGKIVKQVELEGSHINSFEKIETINQCFYIYGGQLPKLIIKLYEGNQRQIVSSEEYYETYGQITKIKVSPDQTNLVVGTAEGVILLFRFQPEGNLSIQGKNIATMLIGQFFK